MSRLPALTSKFPHPAATGCGTARASDMSTTIITTGTGTTGDRGAFVRE